ncbi:MAG: M20/M25/M40 family metallo-hydrolase [Candidatus Omnitrophica bacterium]|nr:M20/M25/M40 family metallo-hydrolase [Candidatus Omnitrophota bacterium]
MSTMWQKDMWLFSKKLVKVVVISCTIIILTRYGWQISFPVFQADPSLRAISQRLEQTVKDLSETIGIRNFNYGTLDSSAQYIGESFEDLGYMVEKWPYQVEGVTFSNLVAKLKNNDSEEYILIGAHYDSCFNPGADDNASGIAGLLELARSLKKEALKTNIMFVAFANEEPPFFQTGRMGSRVFVRDLQTKNILVKSAIVFEMIGFYSDKLFSQAYLPLLGPFYPNQGNFIAVVGSFQSQALVCAIEKNFKKVTSFPMSSVITPSMIPGLNFSDHASFWDVGIPAVMVTDTAYLRNPNYHQDSDRVNTLNFIKMAAVVEGFRKVIINISNQ